VKKSGCEGWERSRLRIRWREDLLVKELKSWDGRRIKGAKDRKGERAFLAADGVRGRVKDGCEQKKRIEAAEKRLSVIRKGRKE
jgi:hypothetical protein